MNAMSGREWVVNTLKALADEQRLKMITWMNETECNVRDLAEKLSLTEPTVSHHLSKLRSVGLITLRTAGTTHFYRLNRNTLDRFKAEFQTIEQAEEAPSVVVSDNTWIDALDHSFSAEDKQWLVDHTINAALKKLPARRKMLDLVLRVLILRFEEGRVYSEKEVNGVIKTLHSDFASLRRELIDYGYLRRERNGSRYWVAPADERIPVTP